MYINLLCIQKVAFYFYSMRNERKTKNINEQIFCQKFLTFFFLDGIQTLVSSVSWADSYFHFILVPTYLSERNSARANPNLATVITPRHLQCTKNCDFYIIYICHLPKSTYENPMVVKHSDWFSEEFNCRNFKAILFSQLLFIMPPSSLIGPVETIHLKEFL